MGKRAFLLALGCLLAGCATYQNPLTQKTERTMYSEQDEIDLGVAIDRKITAGSKIIEPVPPVYTAMLARLASVSDRPGLPYTVRLVENKEINAFSIPGGFVYLHTGLVARLDNEETACVIAHEIGHIAARDSVHRLESTILYSIPARMLFGSDRAAAIQKAVDATFTLTLLKYSRQQELRADTLAVIYAKKAGYDPRAMVRVLRKLQAESATTPPRFLYLLSDHPDIQERIANVEATIAVLENGS